MLVKWLSRVLVLITTVDVVRFASDSFEQAYEKLVGFLMREKEKVSKRDGADQAAADTCR